jgi:putative phosphoribosyl transferase
MLSAARERLQRAGSPGCHHRGMRYADRRDAGERLAPAVVEVVQGPAVVLGIPRGGVLVAVPVARALDAPLDVVVPKKLGAPGNPELGIGAVAPGVRVLDEWLITRLGVSADYLESEIEREEEEMARRTARYRGGRPPVDLGGRTAVVVDDGVATGGTALAALAWVRSQAAGRVVFAAPVGPPQILDRLRGACDQVVLLRAPEAFFAVGEWYERFDQVTDEEVTEALAAASG